MKSGRCRWAPTRSLLAVLREKGLIPAGLHDSTTASAVIEQLQARLRSSAEPRDLAGVLDEQRRALRSLLLHASELVPHYQGGQLPTRPDARLEDIPFLERSTLRDHWQRLVSSHCDGEVCDLKATSGTTGVPVTIIQSVAESFSSLHYDVARVAGLAELDRFERWESPYLVALTDNPAHTPFSTYNPLLDKWIRFEVLDPASPTSCRDIIDVLQELEPAVLVSRPSALKLIAKEAANGHAIDDLPLPIISSGANLYSDDRAFIESSLNARTTDLYAISECSGVASQCPHGGYHVHWEQAIVEVVDPVTGIAAEPGCVGEIVVTDLIRRAMPIVRYRTGDLGRWKAAACPCGLDGPVLEAIDGRKGCYFKLADGRLFNPACMNGPLSKIDNLDQYRINQTALDTLLIEYVSRDNAWQDVESSVSAAVSDRLPSGFVVTFSRVEQLAVPGAKVERYVSHI